MPFSLRAHAGAFLACFASATVAQSVTLQHELRAYVGLQGMVPLPDAGAFGEQINPITGELALVQTDVWLNTNGFPLSMTRSFTPGSYASGALHSGAFGDWQLELPRITTLTVRGGDGHGWQVSGANPYARCSAFAAPPTQGVAGLKGDVQSLGMVGIDPVRDPGGNPIRGPGIAPGEGTALDPNALDPNVWWQGYQLIVPGQGQQEILRRDAANTLAAEGAPQRYPLLTAQQWQIGCLDQTDNGEPGEAFIAMAPNGTKYTFDHLVYEPAPSLDLANLGTVARERATLLVTHIEDRFGNAQEFVYDGDRLVTVVNPAEMQLDLHYRTDVPSLIDQVILRPYTSKPRKWSYQYANLGTGREMLTGVTRPDGAAWGYKLQDLADATLTYNDTTTCSALAPLDAAQTFTGTLSDPNGLTEQLVLAGVRHGRTQVANDCGVSAAFPWMPSQYDTVSLVQRSESGANIGKPTWTYRYAESSESPLWMEIVDPSQRVTRFTFSNVADETEGHPLALDTDRHADGSASRSLRFDYAASNAGPYPRLLGSAVGSRVNNAAFGSVMPLAKQTLTQDGDSYITENVSFNAFGQPTQVRRSNTIAGQPMLETHIDYLNDLPRWVLGLPQSITNTADNTVISQNVYDLAKVTLKEHYRFGLRQASYTYDTQGRVASVTDGNGLATQYNTYVMGSPVTTIYPDGTSENNWPDDFGNIATHIDRAGATTIAEYDVMGRITHLHEPQGDSTAWNDTDYSYVYAEQPGAGITGAHWRYTENHGGAGSSVDYDALMHPILRASRAGVAGVAPWITQAQAYDWRGRAVFASYRSLNGADINQLTQGIRTEYDALDRPIASHQDSEQGVLTTALTYLSGARTQQTDPKGGITTTRYHVLDIPGTTHVLRIDAPEGITQTITRDVYGSPLTLTQSGLYQNAQVSLTRVNYYDGAKRLCRTWNPETGSTVFDYDAGSRETWRAQVDIASNDCGREMVANSAKIQHSYDAMDRVTAISYPGGSSSAQFTYDLMGRLTSADTGLSRWTYAYNHLGLPVGETLVVDGLPFNLSYTYDGNGGLASVSYPDGRLITYAPDAWGRPTQAGSYANNARYLPSGELEYFKYGNGIEYVTEQNARQLPSNLSYALPNGNLLFSQDFRYDQTGNLTQANDLLQGVGSQRTFQYDTLNRLTHATLPGATNSESYSYDPLNNLRRIVNDNGLVRDYTYDPANRLSQAMGSDVQMHSFDYDWRGNITRRDGTPFTFDFANRLTEVGGKESYVYDAFGRRVLKTRLGVGGNKSYYVYSSLTGQLMLQRDNDVASSETDFVYLSGLLVAQATTRKHDLPGAITFTPGSPTSGIYTVSWGRSDGASAYELEEQHDGGAWTQIYRGSATSYAIPGFDWQRPGGTYNYRLRACGTSCGGWVISGPMGVTPQTIDWHTFSPFQGIMQSGYRLSWAAPYSTTSYDVDEGQLNQVGTQMVWTRVATGQRENFIDRPGKRGGTYVYRVTARNAYGSRNPEMTGEITEDPGTSGPPEMPRIEMPKSGDIQVPSFPYPMGVVWNLVGRATSYQVTTGGMYSCTSSSNTCTIKIGAGQFELSVRACNDQGCSPWSPGVYINVYQRPGGGHGGIPLSAGGAGAGEVSGKPSEPAATKDMQP